MTNSPFSAASLLAFTVLALAPAIGQQATPPAFDSGSALDPTMQFIEARLNAIGPIRYVISWKNTNDGSTSTNTIMDLQSKFSADSTRCRISFHDKMISASRIDHDGDFDFLLNSAQSVSVEPLSQLDSEFAAESGSPNFIATSTAPAQFALVVHLNDGKKLNFDFADEGAANGVSKAMTRAIELCAGGASDPFALTAEERSAIETDQQETAERGRQFAALQAQKVAEQQAAEQARQAELQAQQQAAAEAQAHDQAIAACNKQCEATKKSCLRGAHTLHALSFATAMLGALNNNSDAVNTGTDGMDSAHNDGQTCNDNADACKANCQ
jgi:hypothetical protein